MERAASHGDATARGPCLLQVGPLAGGSPSQRFRIALCITELDFGGAERCLVELATGLDPKRFAVTVDCLGPVPRGGGKKLVARLAAAGVPTRFHGGRGLRSAWSVLRRLRRNWRESRPDLVQTFLWHANVLGAIAARQAGVRRIVTGIRVAEPARGWRRPLERWAARGARAACRREPGCRPVCPRADWIARRTGRP